MFWVPTPFTRHYHATGRTLYCIAISKHDKSSDSVQAVTRGYSLCCEIAGLELGQRQQKQINVEMKQGEVASRRWGAAGDRPVSYAGTIKAGDPLLGEYGRSLKEEPTSNWKFFNLWNTQRCVQHGGIIFCCLGSRVRETLCHIENGLTFKDSARFAHTASQALIYHDKAYRF
jgi:hypothetical protein